MAGCCNKIFAEWWHEMIRVIGRKIWLWQFALEEKRQHHAALRHLWRQAVCCIALALVGGGR